MAKEQYYGTGRRKSSVARVRLVQATLPVILYVGICAKS